MVSDMTATERMKRWRLKHPDRYKKMLREWRLKNPDYMKAYRQKNREKIAEQMLEWRARNAERITEKSRQWKKKNRDKITAQNRWWRFNNSDRRNKNEAKRRVITGSIADYTEIAKVYERARWWKQWFDVVVDHILPLSRGGLHTVSNLQIIYRSENAKKYNISGYKPKVVFA